MKKRFAFLILLLVCGLLALSAKDIKGNGQIITRQVPVSEFDQIQVHSQKMAYNRSLINKKVVRQVNYSQKEHVSGTVEVSVDDNLFPYLNIRTENNTLMISVQPDIQILPTRLKIDCNSPSLKQLEMTGPIDVYLNGEIKAGGLTLALGGSGDIISKELLTAQTLTVKLRGSGDINVNYLKCDKLSASVAGSGDIVLKGEAVNGNYQVAGSGDIHAYDCLVGTLECSVKGSGDIQAHATSNMKAEIGGSGEIRYKGVQATKSSVRGSGEIKWIK